MALRTTIESQIRKGYADTSIGQMHYRCTGQGDPLLLLHQTPTCSEVYEPLMRLLAPHLWVVAVDTPGFGMSPQPPHPFTIRDYVRVILETIDALDIEATHLFGHHTGATLACELAVSAPRRVNRLILSSPICLDDAERRRRTAELPNVVLTEDGSYLLTMWRDMVGRAQGGDLPLEIKHREIVWRLKAGPGLFDMTRAVFHYDIAGRLPLLKASTLVISGEFDRMRHSAERAVPLLAGVQYKIIPGGHPNWPEIQNAQELARPILDFVKVSQE